MYFLQLEKSTHSAWAIYTYTMLLSSSTRMRCRSNSPSALSGGDKVTGVLLHARTQLKIFHWQTKSYSEHKALDKLDKSLIELNDKWVESYQGNEATRIKVVNNSPGGAFVLENWNPGSSHAFITEVVHSLRDLRATYYEEPRYEYLTN